MKKDLTPDLGTKNNLHSGKEIELYQHVFHLDAGFFFYFDDDLVPLVYTATIEIIKSMHGQQSHSS